MSLLPIDLFYNNSVGQEANLHSVNELQKGQLWALYSLGLHYSTVQLPRGAPAAVSETHFYDQPN